MVKSFVRFVSEGAITQYIATDDTGSGQQHKDAMHARTSRSRNPDMSRGPETCAHCRTLASCTGVGSNIYMDPWVAPQPPPAAMAAVTYSEATIETVSVLEQSV
jgi:hypothetical protein